MSTVFYWGICGPQDERGNSKIKYTKHYWQVCHVSRMILKAVNLLIKFVSKTTLCKRNNNAI